VARPTVAVTPFRAWRDEGEAAMLTTDGQGQGEGQVQGQELDFGEGKDDGERSMPGTSSPPLSSALPPGRGPVVFPGSMGATRVMDGAIAEMHGIDLDAVPMRQQHPPRYRSW